MGRHLTIGSVQVFVVVVLSMLYVAALRQLSAVFWPLLIWLVLCLVIGTLHIAGTEMYPRLAFFAALSDMGLVFLFFWSSSEEEVLFPRLGAIICVVFLMYLHLAEVLKDRKIFSEDLE